MCRTKLEVIFSFNRAPASAKEIINNNSIANTLNYKLMSQKVELQKIGRCQSYKGWKLAISKNEAYENEC